MVERRGKRFSRERVRTLGPEDFKPGSDGRRVLKVATEADLRAAQCQWAERELTAAGYPAAPKMFQRMDGSWTPERPEDAELFGGADLDEYLLRHHRPAIVWDSQPHCWARMIVADWRAKHSPGRLAVEAAGEFRELATLARVYAAEARQNYRNQARRKSWSKDLARELAAKHDHWPDAWASIPRAGVDDDEADDELDAERDGGYVRTHRTDLNGAATVSQNTLMQHFSRAKNNKI